MWIFSVRLPEITVSNACGAAEQSTLAIFPLTNRTWVVGVGKGRVSTAVDSDGAFAGLLGTSESPERRTTIRAPDFICSFTASACASELRAKEATSGFRLVERFCNSAMASSTLAFAR